MTDSGIILPPQSAARHLLAEAAARCAAVFFVGLPGVGKTLILQQMARLAEAAGRRLFLLQWDVARQAFETPAILASYPEVDGATHALIRVAAGVWARAAVARWAARHARAEPHGGALLIGEAPFVGNRFVELAHPGTDGAEEFLRAPRTLFITPAPTLEVRRAIEAARARDLAQPRHARETANAPMNLLEALMQELRVAGAALGLPDALHGRGYDPAIYVEVYARLLRHRHVRTLTIDTCWPVVGSAYELGVTATELAPDAAEVADSIAVAEALGAGVAQRRAATWYQPA